jgi:hypothetical protein
MNIRYRRIQSNNQLSILLDYCNLVIKVAKTGLSVMDPL